jgi:membrane protease subunit HflC
MNRTVIIVLAAAVAVVLLLVILNAVYIVDESRQVVITQFGKVIGDPITEPGLHMKVPFVQEANYFDKRLLDWEGEKKTAIKTKEQKFIFVEVYARWRITNPTQFLQTLAGSLEVAAGRLDPIIDGIVRDVIAKYDLQELVRSDIERIIYEEFLKTAVQATSGRESAEAAAALELEAEAGQEVSEETVVEEKKAEIIERRALRITKGRGEITDEVFRLAKGELERFGFGIELVDVRIKRINYQPNTQQQVYKRMIAERERIQAQYISEGRRKSTELIGQRDRLAKEIQSEGKQRELEILGEGESEAMSIYKAAYDRDPTSREFYMFYKTLETLKRTMDKETWLILSTDSDFYRYMKSIESR